MVGRTISRYKILARLGEGGMGVVYKAEDTRLERPVALKFLNLAAETGDDSKARFEREARAAAALDHPNICTIYEIDEAEGRLFIAMAFLEGDTVQQLAQKSPLAIDDVLELGSQAAKGLAAAHEKGVIHRDIKSANLMVVRATTGSEPQLKIMDFGLAQLTAGASKLTQAGSTLGTAAYMSPEQSRGERVDQRSDLWSLGVVLYEMLTGQMPFRGEYQQAVVYSILHETPQPITALRSGVDLELERIVFKALQKDPEDRYQSALDLLVDLRALKKQRDSGATQVRPSAFVTAVTPPAAAASGTSPASTDPAGPAPPLPRWRRYGPLGVAAVLLVALGALASRMLGPGSPINPSLPPVVTPITSDAGTESFAAFSPDASQIAFVWDGVSQDNFDIYVRVVDEGGQPLRLTSDPAPETSPAWSPDGRSIAFVRLQGPQSAVLLIPPIGGAERRLADITVRGRMFQDRLLGWSPDGRTLAIAQQGGPGPGEPDAAPDAPGPPPRPAEEGRAAPAPGGPPPEGQDGPRRRGIPGGILLHDLASGQSRLLDLSDMSDDRRARVHSPAFSPDGTQIAFVRGAGPLAGDIYVIPVDGGGSPRRITNDESLVQGLAWAEDGSIIFSSDRGGVTRLWRAEVGPLGGAVFPLLAPGENATLPAVAKQGRRLAYTRSELDLNIWQLDVGHGPEMMKPKSIIVSTRQDHSPQFSPNGLRIAFVSDRSGSNELWVAAADGSSAVKLTSYGGPIVVAPSWSPDGNEIAMQVINGSRFEVDVVPVNGSTTRRLTAGNAGGSLPFWSYDGEWIYVTLREDGLCKIPARGGEIVHQPRLAAEGGSAQESIDGTVLYFAKRGFGGGLWQMPLQGGAATALPPEVMPAGWGRWAVTEKGIFFVDRDRNLKVYQTGTGRVETLTTMEPEAMQYPGPGFSVSPDGMSVLYVRVDRSEADLMLVENYR